MWTTPKIETPIIKNYKVPTLDPKPELTNRENNTAIICHSSSLCVEMILGLARWQGLYKAR